MQHQHAIADNTLGARVDRVQRCPRARNEGELQLATRAEPSVQRPGHAVAANHTATQRRTEGARRQRSCPVSGCAPRFRPSAQEKNVEVRGTARRAACPRANDCRSPHVWLPPCPTGDGEQATRDTSRRYTRMVHDLTPPGRAARTVPAPPASRFRSQAGPWLRTGPHLTPGTRLPRARRASAPLPCGH